VYPEESLEIINWGIRVYNQYLIDNEKYGRLEFEIYNNIGPLIKQRGYLLRDEFLTIGEWFNAMHIHQYQKNDENRIILITKESFQSKNEEIKLHSLVLLAGIGYSAATCILSVVYPNKYLIFDPRVWQMLCHWNYLDSSITRLNHPNDWIKYLNAVSRISHKYNLPTLDIFRALISIDRKFRLRKEIKISRSLSEFF